MIWGEKIAVVSEGKYLRREFPGAQMHAYDIDDLDRIAAIRVWIFLISCYSGPRPPLAVRPCAC